MSNIQEEKTIETLESIITELAEIDKKMYEKLHQYNFVNYLFEFKKKRASVEKNEQDTYAKLKHYMSEYMEKPKFKSFALADRKYKKYLDVFTEDYIVKLMMREISSNFYTLEDFKNPNRWREFIDRKESEYKQARDSEGRTPYKGTFEEFLQESAIITYEYLKDGFSSTKAISEAGKKIEQRMNESNNRTTDYPEENHYSFKHGPKDASGYPYDSSLDDVSKRIHR